MASNIVFLFDVDNTLLNNDHVTADLKRHLHSEVGEERSHRYWQFFEAIRSELGYADYLGALQRYRLEYPRDPKLLAVSYFLMRYPFANRLFPGSLDAIQHVGKGGTPVILSDGDVVFQPHKVYRSGLYEEFNGHVLIYVHKELEMDDVEQRFPADHYVMVDDKLRILEAMKKVWKNKLTTVFVKQGHYANDPKTEGQYPPADVSLERIGDLVNHDIASLRAAGSNLKHEGKSA